jgi:uncharacterized protein
MPDGQKSKEDSATASVHSASTSVEAADAARYAQVVHLLRQPGTYPDHPRSVDVIETHISCVFLTDRFVYKLKKPVHYDFCDFSTLAGREHACREEVRLNRRLAHDVYLGVLPIVADAGQALHLAQDEIVGGNAKNATIVDWVVQMRRLPIENTLDALVRAGRLKDSQTEQLAEKLAEFYAAAKRLAVAPGDYRRAIRTHLRGNLHELLAPEHALAPAVVSRIHAAQSQFLALAAPLFDARVLEGRVVEGHGDLRPEHICFEDVPVIFDCIEFNPELRRLDVADELSFLAMECDRLGATGVGQRVIDAYATRCADRPPPELWSFYKSYRACVRAKVAALRSRQLTGAAQSAGLDEAREYLQLADGYAGNFARPLVLVVGGLMGSGKSTLAAALADAFACPRLATDVVRRELFGAAKAPAGYDEGTYGKQNRERVYEELFARADRVLGDRISVVLDGTFLSAALLNRAAGLAAARRADLLVVRCGCPAAVARKRIADRAAAGGDPSEARPELYDRQKAEIEACPDRLACVEVDTTDPLDVQIDSVIVRLRGAVAGAY